MTKTQQLAAETIFTTTLAASIGFFWAMYSNTNQPKFNIFARVPNIQEHITTPTPSLPKPLIASQISPDGTKKVIMRTSYNSDATKTYSFSVSDSSDANELSIYTKTLDESKYMVVPFNTWSPDNNYFFVEEHIMHGGTSNVFVFTGSGKSFTDNETYLDISDTFTKQDTGNIFSEATGWASESLIILNTTTQDAQKGPSYWFEVPSKIIIQLSTEF